MTFYKLQLKITKLCYLFPPKEAMSFDNIEVLSNSSNRSFNKNNHSKSEFQVLKYIK